MPSRQCLIARAGASQAASLPLRLLCFATVMAGHSGYTKISGRVIRVSEISGTEKYNPKFVENNQNPTFRVPDISGTGSG